MLAPLEKKARDLSAKNSFQKLLYYTSRASKKKLGWAVGDCNWLRNLCVNEESLGSVAWAQTRRRRRHLGGGDARLILTLGWAPKESLERAQKVRTHHIFAQRNEAFFVWPHVLSRLNGKWTYITAVNMTKKGWYRAISFTYSSLHNWLSYKLYFLNQVFTS